MTSPRWEATDSFDLLDVLADPHPLVGAEVCDVFLHACRRDAMAHDGLVSVNNVREILADEGIDPRRFSAMWSRFTGRDRPMVKSGGWEVCKGSTSGNDGRPYPTRRWVGGT